MCHSEIFGTFFVRILRRISPFQRSAALGGPFFCARFLGGLIQASARSAKRWLIDCLSWCGPMEKLNSIAALPMAEIGLASWYPSLSVLPALCAVGLNVWSLWQGSTFWLIRLSILWGVGQCVQLQRFNRCKYQNYLWFYPVLIVATIAWFSTSPSGVEMYWAFGLTLLAVAEHINHYHVQYDR